MRFLSVGAVRAVVEGCLIDDRVLMFSIFVVWNLDLDRSEHWKWVFFVLDPGVSVLLTTHTTP